MNLNMIDISVFAIVALPLLYFIFRVILKEEENYKGID